MSEMWCIRIAIILLALGYLYYSWQLCLAKKFIEFLLIHLDIDLDELKKYAMKN